MQTVPSKSVVIGPQPGSLGRVTARGNGTFEVESRNAADRPSKLGGDALTVVSQPKWISTNSTVTELADGRYKVDYVAPAPGSYQVSIKMNGEHINGSPFKLTVSVPSAKAEMCTVSGKGLSRMTAGEMASFQVSYNDRQGTPAPAAELDIRLKPEGTILPGPDDPIEIPPKVQSTFDTFDKDGSGDIDFSELRLALDLLGYGGDRKAAAVLLRRYDADGGGLQIEEFAMLVEDMRMAAATGYLLHGVTPTADKSVREVKYEVKVAGMYDIHIGLAAGAGGGTFEGSPFSLTVVPARASPETTELPPRLVTSGLKTPVGESGSFEIQAHDAYKNMCIEGGAPVRVSTGGNESFEASVCDLGNGKYEIRYTCEQSGMHRMAVTIGEKHIKGSPLHVICEPGPMLVGSCQLLVESETISTVAGTPNSLTIRARDRFGNATSNVPPGINFTVQLRRRGAGMGAVPMGGASPTGGGANLLYGARTSTDANSELGRLEASEGAWSREGVYELVYVPASRGSFEAQVLCVRDVREQEAAPKSKWTRLGPPKKTLLEAAQLAATLKTEEVPGFQTFDVKVAPLGPDATMSVVTNAARWHASKLLAGTRLVLMVQLRDRFGNPCEYPADGYAGGVVPLQASMFKLGVRAGKNLNGAEAGPHALRLAPCNEAIGGYEVRHALIRSGRFLVRVLLAGQPLRDIPINFRVGAAHAVGRRSRLEAHLPKPEADENDAQSTTPSASLLPPTAEREPPKPLVGVPYWVSLQARDAHGNAIESGGARVELSVDAPPIIAGSELDHMMAPKLAHSVTDNGDGVYLLMVTAVQEGTHTLMVHLDGQEVIGSPLTLQIEKPPVLASTKIAGKSRGDTLFAVASAIANMGVNWAYRNWEEFTDAKMEQMAAIRSAAFAILHVDLRWSFNTWLDKWHELKWVRNVISNAAHIRTRGQLAQAVNLWIRFSKVRARVIAKLALIISSEANNPQRQLLLAFNTWKANRGEIECPWDLAPG